MKALYKECLECGTRRQKGTQSFRWWATSQFCSNACQMSNTQGRYWNAARSNVTERGCWLWPTRGHAFGYGMLMVEGERIGAHVASWTRAHGPVPEGLWVLHKCDVPACVNPDHLFLGTALDNNRDKLAKGRHRGWPKGRSRKAQMQETP